MSSRVTWADVDLGAKLAEKIAACPTRGSHHFIAGVCWYCPAKDPRPYSERNEFRGSATSAFGWTITPNQGREMKATNQRKQRRESSAGQEILG